MPINIGNSHFTMLATRHQVTQWRWKSSIFFLTLFMYFPGRCLLFFGLVQRGCLFYNPNNSSNLTYVQTMGLFYFPFGLFHVADCHATGHTCKLFLPDIHSSNK